MPQDITTHAPRCAGAGGARPRRKGDIFERALVRAFQDVGFAAERVPLSGSAGGSYSGDFSVPLLGRDLTIEAKIRKHGFKELYAWLENRDALIIRADHHHPLVVAPLKLALEIALVAERCRGQ